MASEAKGRTFDSCQARHSVGFLPGAGKLPLASTDVVPIDWKASLVTCVNRSDRIFRQSGFLVDLLQGHRPYGRALHVVMTQGHRGGAASSPLRFGNTRGRWNDG